MAMWYNAHKDEGKLLPDPFGTDTSERSQNYEVHIYLQESAPE